MKNKNEKIKLAEYVPQVGETLDDNAHEVAEMLANYEQSDSYICDAITEHADGLVDIYNSDLLLEWAKSHLVDIEEANKEFGTPSDIIRQIQQAQYKVHSDELYDGLDDGGHFFALKVAAREVEELTQKQLDEIESLPIDNDDRIGQLVDAVKEILQNGAE